MPINPTSERGQSSNTDDSEILSDAALGVDRSDGAGSETPGSKVQSSPTTPTDGEGIPTEAEVAPDFGGLPFKSTEEFVKGHKSLQDAYRQSRNQIWQMQQQMEQLKPLLAQLQTPAQTKEDPIDIPKFLESFIQEGPKAITTLADKQIEAKLKQFEQQYFAPHQVELSQLRAEREIDRFMNEHPEVTKEDEDAILDVIRETPWLQRMQGSTYEKLDAAFSVLIRKEPTKFSSRSEERRVAVSQGLNSMKQAATSIGAKAGVKSRVAKDEFDDVLDNDAVNRSRWR